MGEVCACEYVFECLGEGGLCVCLWRTICLEGVGGEENMNGL